MLNNVRFGRYIYALGGNEQAARISGLNIDNLKIRIYAFAGLLYGVAALLLSARIGSGQPGLAVGYELDAIAAAVIGGTSLTGGIGTIWGTIVGGPDHRRAQQRPGPAQRVGLLADHRQGLDHRDRGHHRPAQEPLAERSQPGEYSMTTSRQRVITAVNHGEPDRIPIDLGGHRSSGIMAIAYNRLKQHLGIKTGDIYVYDFVQQLAIIEPEVLDRFGVDTIELGRGFACRPKDWHDWVLPDGTPCKIPAHLHPIQEGNDWCFYHEDGTLIAIQKEGCLYLEQTHWPYMDSSSEAGFGELNDAYDHMMWFEGRGTAGSHKI